MGCDSPLKGWKNPETGGIQFRRDGAREEMEVGCGSCLGCNMDYRRMWAMRIAHEAAMYEYSGGNSFITLTYRDPKDCSIKQLEDRKHVPNDWSLSKRHYQLFMKRLRKELKKREIRYFAAGEYGRKCKHGIDLERNDCPLCNCGRPHFHACLFGVSFDDLEAYQSDGGIMRYTSPTLERIWGYGFVDVGDVTYASAAYTAGYVLKKVRGVKSDFHYCTYDLDGVVTWIQPEFVLMSRGKTCKLHRGMPYQVDCPNCTRGIGRDWLERFADDVFPSDEVPVAGYGVVKGVPRYYYEWLKNEKPEMYEQVKAIRNKFMEEHADEYTYERLLAKHKCKKARQNLKPKLL
jgi:hypothetical protein